jgi:hypothetical protein
MKKRMLEERDFLFVIAFIIVLVIVYFITLILQR